MARADSADRFDRYRDDPVGFVREVLGEEPWPVQAEILETLWRDRRLVVPSCFDSGKSWSAARAVLAWVATDPEAIAITTAPTWEHVKTVLWGEVRAGWRDGLPGKLSPMAPEWHITHANYAQGISVDRAESLQGRHGGRVLVVMDEAPGVEPYVYEAMRGLLTSEDTAALLIGNPNEATGPFYDAACSSNWTTISISAFDTPNFTAGHIVNPKLVTPEWERQMAADYGTDSYEYQTKVLGRFSDAANIVVVSLSWYDRCVAQAPAPAGEVMGGLDIARFGSDDTALAIVSGPTIQHLERINGADGVRVAGWVAERLRRFGVRRLNGDSGGLGGPVLDILRSQGFLVDDVNAGAAPTEPEEFVLLRDQLWWTLRSRFRDGAVFFSPDLLSKEVRLLRSQATALRYGYDIRGRVKVESKADAQKRGIPSPDLADALCLAFYRGAGAAFVEAWGRMAADGTAPASASRNGVDRPPQFYPS